MELTWNLQLSHVLTHNFCVCLSLQLFELGTDGGDNEGDGELLAETEEVAFECGAR